MRGNNEFQRWHTFVKVRIQPTAITNATLLNPEEFLKHI